MRDKVFDRLDVVDRSGDEAAGVPRVEEAVGQGLEVPVDPGHQVVHDPVGGDVREEAVAVAGGAPQEVDADEEEADLEQCFRTPPALGQPLDKFSDEQRGQEVGRGKEEAAADREGHGEAPALQKAIKLDEKGHCCPGFWGASDGCMDYKPRDEGQRSQPFSQPGGTLTRNLGCIGRVCVLYYEVQ